MNSPCSHRVRRIMVWFVTAMPLCPVALAVAQVPRTAAMRDGNGHELELREVGRDDDRRHDEANHEGFVIEGLCTDGFNAPMPGVTLRLFCAVGDRDITPEFLAETTSGKQGTFRFADLTSPRLSPSALEPRRVYFLVATSPGKASSLQHIASSRLLAPCHMVLLNSRTVQGRVTDTIGNPIEGAVVSRGNAALYRRIGGDFLHGSFEGKTDAEGNYQIGDLPDFEATPHGDTASRTVSNVQPANQRLIVEHPEYGRQAFAIPTTSAPLNIVLARLAFLEGRVIDGLTQMPVPDVSLLVEQSSETPIRVTSDGDGAFRLSIPPGTYTIRSSNPLPNTRVAARTVGVVSGDNPRLEVELVTDGIVEGRVLDSRGRPIAKTDIARLRIGIKETTDRGRSTATRSVAVVDDGTYRMRVPPGENYPFVFSNRPIPRHFLADREPETAEDWPAVTVGSGETARLDFFIEPIGDVK